MRRPHLPRLEILEARLAPAHDTLGTAVGLPFGASGTAHVAAILASDNAVELYAVSLTAGERVDIRATAARNTVDLYLRLFDAAGGQVAHNDEGGSGHNPALVYEVTTTSIYYVGVSSFRNLGYDPLTSGTGENGKSHGAFTLDVTHLPPDDTPDSLSRAVAVTLDAGATVTLDGSLPDNDAIRLYSFQLDAGERMRVRLASVDVLDGGLRLFDAAGRPLLTVDEYAADGEESFTWEAHAATTFYVGVSAYDNFTYDPQQPWTAAGGQSAGDYTLSFERLAPGSAHDTFFSALPVSFDASGHTAIASTLADDNAVEVYAVPLQAGDRLTATVLAQQQGSPLNAVLRLFNADDLILFTNDDSVGKDPRIRYDITRTGIYYVAVSSYNNLSYNIDQPRTRDQGLSAGPFTLDLRRTTSPAAEQEPTGVSGANDTRATAEPILGATDLTGSLAAGDVDTYRLDVSIAGRLAVQVRPTAGSDINLRVALYRADGGLLAQCDDVSAVDLSAVLDQHLLAGTFYLAVSLQTPSAAPADRRGYRLTTTFEPAYSPLRPLELMSSAYDVQAGDFNEDGRLDLVIAEGGLDVLVQQSDGSFVRTQRQSASGNPVALAIGDVNGDRHLDVVSADRYGNTVSLYLGNGDGTFGPAVVVGPGEFLSTVALVDLNGDGRLDLLSLSGDTDLLRIQLGAGDGTFAPAAKVRVGGNPRAMTVADLNGDGRLDVATANEVAATVSVLLGVGDGTFLPRHDFVTGLGSYGLSLVAADLTGDGVVDLAAADEDTAVVQVLRGRGDGTFQAAGTMAVDERPNGLAAGDFNGDGLLDLATGNYGGRDVSVLLNRGPAGFAPAVHYNTGGSSGNVTAVDLDGDGRVDLLTPNLSSDLSILHGQGDGTFQTLPRFGTGGSPYEAAVGDYNNDGRLDVVSANEGSDDVSVLLGRGDGSFQSERRFAVGDTPFALATGDFNRDGRLDLATANSHANTVSVLLGLGDGTFRQQTVHAAGVDPWRIVATDLTGDGMLDLAVVNQDGQGLTILVGRGDGTFARGRRVPLPARPETAIAVPTANGRRSDLVVAADEGDTFWRVTWQPNGRFRVTAFAAGTSSVTDLAVGDVNGDSIADLLATDIEADQLIVLLGNSDGSFADPQTTDLGFDPIAVIPADYTGDGMLDAVVVEQDGTVVRVFPGLGDGTFDDPLMAVMHTHGYRGATGDFNGDGRADLTLPNEDTNEVSVLLNQGDGRLRELGPTSGAAVRAVPLVADLTGDGIADSVVLDGGGRLLFRQGQANGFAPAVVLNSGNPARDVILLPTPTGVVLAVAAADADRVDQYAWAGNGFVPTPLFATGRLPARLGQADLNGDGRPDLVAVCAFDNTVTVAFQAADGTFAPRTVPVGNTPSAVAFADVDGDGRIDILVTGQSAGDVTVLINDPSALFTRQARYRAGEGLFGLEPSGGGAVRSRLETVEAAALDVTGDGRPDLLAVDRGDRRVVLLQATDGGFADPTLAGALPTTNRPGQLTLGDVNGDGRPDVLLLMEDTGEVWVWLAGPTGVSGPWVSPAGNTPTGFSLTDANADGIPDLAVGNPFGDVLFLIGHGDGTFEAPQYTDDRTTLSVLVGADGRPQVLVANQQADRVTVQTTADGAHYDPMLALPTGGLRAPGNVRWVRLDGPADPYPDAVVLGTGSNTLVVYRQTAPGVFTPPISYPVGTNPVAVTVADLNGDHLPDLLVTNQGSNDVSILMGRLTGGAWTAVAGSRIAAGGFAPIGTTVRDVTGDGRLDLIVTNRLSAAGGSTGSLSVVPGRGQGFFDDRAPRTVPLPGVPIDPPVFAGGIGVMPDTAGRLLGFDPATLNPLGVVFVGGVRAVAPAGDRLVVAAGGRAGRPAATRCGRIRRGRRAGAGRRRTGRVRSGRLGGAAGRARFAGAGDAAGVRSAAGVRPARSGGRVAGVAGGGADRRRGHGAGRRRAGGGGDAAGRRGGGAGAGTGGGVTRRTRVGCGVRGGVVEVSADLPPADLERPDTPADVDNPLPAMPLGRPVEEDPFAEEAVAPSAEAEEPVEEPPPADLLFAAPTSPSSTRP
ncbi:MAG: FG-GAP-like repeat-containing protein [Gemmataceae bacterium]